MPECLLFSSYVICNFYVILSSHILSFPGLSVSPPFPFHKLKPSRAHPCFWHKSPRKPTKGDLIYLVIFHLSFSTDRRTSTIPSTSTVYLNFLPEWFRHCLLSPLTHINHNSGVASSFTMEAIQLAQMLADLNDLQAAVSSSVHSVHSVYAIPSHPIRSISIHFPMPRKGRPLTMKLPRSR